MWVVVGPFDGQEAGVIDFRKEKLLKPGKKYRVSRDPSQLYIFSKKISHKGNCELTVGPHDPNDPLFRPKLVYKNIKDKPYRLICSGQPIIVAPGATRELHDGDTIAVLVELDICVRWDPVCCYAQPVNGKLPVLPEACASAGISLVSTHHEAISHHLTSVIEPSSVVAASLMTATRLVTPQWLEEVIRLADLPLNQDPRDGTSLESQYDLPSLARYRPPFSPDLPDELRKMSIWEPNEARVKLFVNCSFYFVVEKGRYLDSHLVDAIRHGGGWSGKFDIKEVSKLHSFMVSWNAKTERRNLVFVADTAVLPRILKDQWEKFIAKAEEFNYTVHSLNDVIQAVLRCDASVFGNLETLTKAESVSQGELLSSPMPDVVPNTHADEPTHPPEHPLHSDDDSQRPAAGRGKLVRRAAPKQTSRAHTPERAASGSDEDAPVSRRKFARRAQNSEQKAALASSSEGEDIASTTTRRRPLTRRVGTTVGNSLLMDDITLDMDDPPSLPPPPPVAPTPGRRNLKRRVGMGGESANRFSPSLEDDDEPPAKKLRALADDATPLPWPNEDTDKTASGPTQSGGAQSGMSQRRLRAVMEEEESQPQSAVVDSHSTLAGSSNDGTTRKRKAVDEGGVDVAANEMHSRKKRAIESGNSVDPAPPPTAPRASSRPPFPSKPLSTFNSKDPQGQPPMEAEAPVPPSRAKPQAGAEPGKQDTDAAFLKALASTKRGKKKEDDFDREFNNLRISKPVVDTGMTREDENRALWNVLDEFGGSEPVGNFMVICELEVWRNAHPFYDASERNQPNAQWENLPNYKKFRKNGNARNTAPRGVIELQAKTGDDDSDLGKDDDESVMAFESEDTPPSASKDRQRRMQHRGGSNVSEEDVDELLSQTSRSGSATAARVRTSSKRTLSTVPEDSGFGDDGGGRKPSTKNVKRQETPLFFDSENENDAAREGSSMASRAASRPATRRTTRAGSRVPRQMDVDSDEDQSNKSKRPDSTQKSGSRTQAANVRATRTRRPNRRRVQQDDDDDREVF